MLCELQVAMMEKGIDHKIHMTRNVMPKAIRDVEDSSYRNIRDWYIYREYMNNLEYVVHSLGYLKHNSRY